MLILRRKVGESLLIGDQVKITVLDGGDGGVRLAIDAPKEILILRSELVGAIEANRDASNEQAQPQLLLEFLGKPHGQPPRPPGAGEKA